MACRDFNIKPMMTIVSNSMAQNHSVTALSHTIENFVFIVALLWTTNEYLLLSTWPAASKSKMIKQKGEFI